MGPNSYQWQRKRFKNNKVWLAVDERGNPVVKNGKWLIKYRLEDSYDYWVRPENVRAIEASTSAGLPAAAAEKKKAPESRAAQSGLFKPTGPCLNVYTDGAASGNPGPAGIGVVLCQNAGTTEIYRYIGETTNNVAELEAIRTALAAVENRVQTVVVHTDSGYACGVLSLGWKAKKNQALIESIKALMREFEDLKLVKVRGHAGDRWNERADELARKAIKTARR